MQKRILQAQYPNRQKYWQRQRQSLRRRAKTKPSRLKRRSIELDCVFRIRSSPSSVCPRVLILRIVYTISAGIASPKPKFFDLFFVPTCKKRQSTMILVLCRKGRYYFCFLRSIQPARLRDAITLHAPPMTPVQPDASGSMSGVSELSGCVV